MELNHIDRDGSPKMVDVGQKPVTERIARACGHIRMKPETLNLICLGSAPKGDVLTTAKIAGISAAKRTSELIPMCHNIPLDSAAIDFKYLSDGIEIEATAKTSAKTGVEMEALTAVSVCALTIYDMLKAADKTMEIGGIYLMEKEGGKSGHYRREI